MELVSVIIPCYNQGLFIEECIESVNSQIYNNIEIIVVDDGSNDQYTIDILRKLNIKYPKIKIIRIQNSGVCVARNVGIKNSNGKYIVPLDADDKIGHRYIDKCIEILGKNADIGVVYSMIEHFGSKTGVVNLPQFSEKQMLIANVVVCTAMYRKSDYEKTIGYNSNMIYGYEDWDFWLSMIELRKKFYRIDEILFYYRKKEVSRTTEINGNKRKQKSTITQIFNNHRKLYQKYNISLEYVLSNYK